MDNSKCHSKQSFYIKRRSHILNIDSYVWLRNISPSEIMKHLFDVSSLSSEDIVTHLQKQDNVSFLNDCSVGLLQMINIRCG